MLTVLGRILKRQEHGFTLIELVLVLAILSILVALAFPRYLGARKKAFKAEAQELLQEAKTMEWAYYQQFNQFDTSGNSIGLILPGGMHWSMPTFGGTGNQSVSVQLVGKLTPISPTDSTWVLLYSDGSSSGGSSF